MERKAWILSRGRDICLSHKPYTGPNNRRYADASGAVYILAEQRFITNHDDTAGFVELIDIRDRVVRSWKFDYPMQKRFSDPDLYDDDCLIAYLMDGFSLPLVGRQPPQID